MSCRRAFPSQMWLSPCIIPPLVVAACISLPKRLSCGGYVGMCCAWDIGITTLLVETDSLKALCIIQNDLSRRGCYNIVLHIDELRCRCWEVQVLHVARTGNHVVDRMASLATRDSL
ncbi:hypothetical protein V6N12_045671 [Hibiscus sabdariffa]|uniref:RNase H type-1 domain-containing protein n=1 Tax=Hibiscus sabdariffa TaxID=183260 RepID=A0ABR2G3E9_9ROSI